MVHKKFSILSINYFRKDSNRGKSDLSILKRWVVKRHAGKNYVVFIDVVTFLSLRDIFLYIILDLSDNYRAFEDRK